MKVKQFHLLLLLMMTLASNNVFCQRIRKDHREMTPSEKLAFIEAVKLSKTKFYNEGWHHDCHFGGPTTPGNPLCTVPSQYVIHGNEIFLPWHRYFQWDMETFIRGNDQIGGGEITFPYWDWRVETSASNSTWDDSDFLGQLNNTPDWMPLLRGWTTNLNTRSLQGSVTGTVNLFMGYSSYDNFRGVLENTIHAWGHQEIGGAMSGRTSPWDPVFFLHHGMLDKLWQEWEEKTSGFQTTFTQFTQTADYPIHSNDLRDSRRIRGYTDNDHQVWYAYNKKLLLDGMEGDFSGSGTYCYTAWNGTSVEGTIYAGNVKRDANDNVILDNQGGFVVSSQGFTNLYAGKAIYLMGGFKTVQGATFSAKCVSTPCGFSSNTFAPSPTEEIAAIDPSEGKLNTKAFKIQVIPNPIVNELNLQYEVEKEALVRVTVFNMFGQVIAQYQPGIQAPGQYTYTISAQDWPKGVYNCRISIGKESSSVKTVH